MYVSLIQLELEYFTILMFYAVLANDAENVENAENFNCVGMTWYLHGTCKTGRLSFSEVHGLWSLEVF